MPHREDEAFHRSGADGLSQNAGEQRGELLHGDGPRRAAQGAPVPKGHLSRGLRAVDGAIRPAHSRGGRRKGADALPAGARLSLQCEGERGKEALGGLSQNVAHGTAGERMGVLPVCRTWIPEVLRPMKSTQ